MVTGNPFLFPHTRVNERDLAEVLFLFEGITICQPWGMDPIPVKESDRDRVTILHPSAAWQPEGDLKILVAQYSQWMREHPGRGYEALFSQMPLGETTWEIRGNLRHAAQSTQPEPGQAHLLKWHILLHLALESEQSQLKADEALYRLVQGPSPLHGALEDDPLAEEEGSSLTDIPITATSPYMNDRRLGQVLEAWIGLFGNLLPKEALLLTFQPHVLEYLSTRMETGKPIPWGSQDPGHLVKREGGFPSLVFSSPAPDDPLLTPLFGKTLILMLKSFS